MRLVDKGCFKGSDWKTMGYRIDLQIFDHQYLRVKTDSYWRSKALLEKLYVEWPRLWVEIRAWVDEHASYYCDHIDYARGMVSMGLSGFPEVDVTVHLSFSFSQERIFSVYLDFKTWKILDISLGC